MQYKYISWKQLVIDCITLSKEISTVAIDEIIGISRGGLVFSRLLSDYLSSSAAVTILGLGSYSGTQQRSEFVVTQQVTKDMHGKTVLLVDDISDTGKTFLNAQTIVTNLGAQTIYTASMYTKPKTLFVPDFWRKAYDSWVIFPYEVNEIYLLLAKEHGHQKAKRLLQSFGVQEWEIYG